MATDPFVELLDRARSERAALGRRQERLLRQVAEEEASLAGTLVDLAELGSSVAVRTQAGRAHHGVVVGVGGDFCVLRPDRGDEVSIVIDAITTLRPHPGRRHEPASGARPPASDLRMVEALAAMAPERPRLLVVARGGEAVAGALQAVGSDVVTVGLDEPPRARCYVSVSSLAEVGRLRSG